MNKEVKKIIKSGKDSIIELALKIIDEDIKKEDFSSIKISANSKDVCVSFSNPIKFLAINTAYNTDPGVYLIDKMSFSGEISNPADYEYYDDNIPYYKPTEESKKHIAFVVESINKSVGIGSFKADDFEDEMIIRENKTYYDISVVSEYQESWYKIKKNTGEIYDAGHVHLEPPPFKDEDKFVDIF